MGINRQLRSVIQWDDPNSSEIFVKFNDRGDEIKNASKLILQEGQGCIVTYQGKTESVLENSGIYDLKSENIPFLTSLKKLLTLREKSEHVVGIWFYRKADILNMRWGTRVPIAYADPIYTFPVQLSAFGNFSIKIIQPQWFYENIIAGEEAYTHDDLKEIFLSRITQPITNYLANAKFSYVDIDSNLNTIADAAKQETTSIFNNLGFDVLDFRIEGSRFDHDTLTRIGKISDVQAEVKAAKLAGINYTEHQQLQAMRDAANNEGGAAGMLVSASTGIGIGGMMNQSMNENKDDPMVRMKKLKDMMEASLISAEEYEAKKKEILEAM